jgi:hypothetical protein
MTTNNCHPLISKKSRGFVLVHVTLNFNNVNIDNITPVQTNGVKQLIDNGVLSPLFLTLQKNDPFETYICRGLDSLFIEEQSNTKDNKLDHHSY